MELKLGLECAGFLGLTNDGNQEITTDKMQEGLRMLELLNDRFANEEYWRFLDVYRNKKPGFSAVKTSFCNDVYNPNTNSSGLVIT